MQASLMMKTATQSTRVNRQLPCPGFKQFNSRKRPFSAVSQLQPRLPCVRNHKSPYADIPTRCANVSSQQPRCLVRAQAQADTEDLVSTPKGSDKARPKNETLPQQQPRFDWCDQWYAIAYEK